MSVHIDLILFDAGGGHRAAATALESIIRRQHSWETRLVNLQDLLDSIDIVRKLTGIRVQDGYNLLLRHGWTFGAAHMLKALHAAIRFYHPSQVRLLRQFWSPNPPDMVVSLVPNFNRALAEALEAERPGAPHVTILTDLADYPPHFWIEKQNQWVICGSDHAVDQAKEIGIPPRKIRRASGMILRPAFYERPNVDRAAERVRLGLSPGLPTGLLLFGGHGSSKMIGIVRSLQEIRRPLQLICICGRNRKLEAELRRQPSSFPMHVVGFTNEIPRLMEISDFFIGKPGPGSISEAVTMKLPVILERNAWTLPQERFNTDWVRDQNLGMVVPSFRRVGEAVNALLEPGTLARYRQAVARVENRALFEIPDMLAEILSASRRGSAVS